MSAQSKFLLQQALQYLQAGNHSSAELFIKQALKLKPEDSDALNLLGVVKAKNGSNDEALQLVDRALKGNRKNGIAHSNKGNILLALGRPSEAIKSYNAALAILPTYADAYGNLANAYQDLGAHSEAISLYKKAITLDPSNADFFCNLGNAFWKLNFLNEAAQSYEAVLRINPNHASAYFYLGQLQLFMGFFRDGWRGYEWRWFSREVDPKPLETSRPFWRGDSFDGTLFIWGEQGLGDQILHGSMLNDLRRYSQKIIVSLDKKLLPIFERSFPDFRFVARANVFDESSYEQQLPIASLGKFFRNDLGDFKNSKSPFLFSNKKLSNQYHQDILGPKKIICGISWKSSNQSIGAHKSINFIDIMRPFAQSSDIRFVSLQYGDTESEIEHANNELDTDVLKLKELDLYEDVDSTLSLIDACDIVITTSNTIAHMAGSISKETLLILPFSLGKFWYWNDIDGISLWYPSVRVFKQESQGDWSKPIQAVKAYMENRFGV